VAVLARSGRVTGVGAGGIGATLAIVSAMLVAPIPMSPYGAALAACHGAWLAAALGLSEPRSRAAGQAAANLVP
jgi:hypothetical protein